jgi:hypothetical protein
MTSMTMIFAVSTCGEPKTLAQYISTYIFLILLSIFFCFLLAWKHVLLHLYAKQAGSRRIVVTAPSPPSTPVGDEKADRAGEAVVLPQKGWRGRLWSFGTNLPGAGMMVLVLGVGYLM